MCGGRRKQARERCGGRSTSAAGAGRQAGAARGLTTADEAPRRIFSRAERSCRPTWVTPMGQAALPMDTPMYICSVVGLGGGEGRDEGRGLGGPAGYSEGQVTAQGSQGAEQAVGTCEAAAHGLALPSLAAAPTCENVTSLPSFPRTTHLVRCQVVALLATLHDHHETRQQGGVCRLCFVGGGEDESWYGR
jgi:hypothetical protein